jgi:hypothetical protein
MPYNPTPGGGDRTFRDSGFGNGDQYNRLSLNDLYQLELGREPDQAGMDYWRQQMANGMSQDQIRQMFDQSQEGQAYNQRPAPQNQDYTSSTIRNWIMKGGGEIPETVLADMVPINRGELSPEQLQRFNEYKRPGYERNINNLYQQELGRKGDQAGMDYWRQQFENGMSMDQIQQMFDQSEEGQAYNQQPPRFANDPRNPHIGKPPMHPEIEDALRLANQRGQQSPPEARPGGGVGGPHMPSGQPPMPQYTIGGQGLPQGQNISQAMGLLRRLGVM